MKKQSSIIIIGTVVFFTGIFITSGLAKPIIDEFLFPTSYTVTRGDQIAGDEDSLNEKDDSNILKVNADLFWWFWHYYHANVKVYYDHIYCTTLIVDIADTVGGTPIRIWVYYTTGDPYYSGYIDDGTYYFQLDSSRTIDYVHIWLLSTSPVPLTVRLEVDLCIAQLLPV